MSIAARWLLLVSLLPAALAHDPITTNLTWTREIVRVVYQRCASCHRQDGSAFSLVAYRDAARGPRQSATRS